MSIVRLLFATVVVSACALFSGSASAQVPGAADFQKIVLADNLENPVDFTFAPDGRIFILDRAGKIWLYKPDTQSTVLAGTIQVFAFFEDGLIGIALDPNFETNNLIYLHYSVPGAISKNRVSRFTMIGDALSNGSEQILLEWDVQRNSCCHAAGDMEFDTAGNLYISTGDNAQHGPYGALDEVIENHSAEGTSADTTDLRGKILRITPTPAGYTIPAGNLFPGGVGGAPEIYVMGARNPYRIWIDPVTGWLYWGDVGPDANVDSVDGVSGLDEINLTKAPGNYGWPHFIGMNNAYRNTYLDYYFNPAAPTNDSQWNDGPVVLPPAQPALMEFPHKCYLTGPIYRFDPAVTTTGKLPIEFDDLYFYFEFNGSDVFLAELDASGGVVGTPSQWASSLADGLGFIELKVGPDHRLYILEYGAGCCAGNTATGKLTVYNHIGIVPNSAPVPMLTATPTAGPVPLTVNFSSAGSFDPDGDPFTIEWDFNTDGVIDSTDPNPSHTYMSIADFNAQLKLNDGMAVGVANVTIHSGNNIPIITINEPACGSLIDWNQTIDFDVSVTDAEDGSTTGGTIPCVDVTVTPSLGHLSHSHDSTPEQACTGSFDLLHNHDVEGVEDIFWVVNAQYTDNNGLTAFEQAKLWPRRHEAEFFDSASSVQVLGNTDTLGGGLSVARGLQVGANLLFEGRNLQGVSSCTFRVASTNGVGTVELHADSPAGPLVATAAVPNTGGLDQWTDVTVPIVDPGGKHDLYVVFLGQFDLNYFEFDASISTDTFPPYLLDIEAPDPNTLCVRFSEPVDMGTATTVGNYSADAGVGITGAALGPDGKTVCLTTTNMPPDTLITVTASNVDDLNGHTAIGTQITYVPFDPTVSVIKINCGGPTVTTSGETWVADVHFNGGNSATNIGAVDNTDDDVLFHTERWGNCFYNIPVGDPGEYTVQVHFAEMFFGGPGGGPNGTGLRLFSCNVEGQSLLSNYDLNADVGPATAVMHEITVTTNDGNISIQMVTDVDNAKISAIEILKPGVDVGPPQAPLIVITSPGNNAQVAQDFTLTYFVENADPNVALDVDGVPSGTTTLGAPFSLVGLAPGMHLLTVTLLDDMLMPTPYFDEVMVTVVPTAVPPTEIRINCGGPAVTVDGNDWLADIYSTGGTPFSVGFTPFVGTADLLFESERFGNFSYEIPVDNGTYDVVLHFAEIFFGVIIEGFPGQRVFDVTVEGQLVLDNYDIIGDVGVAPPMGEVPTASHTFEDVLVADGFMTIVFTGVVDFAKVSAIEVLNEGTIPPSLDPTIGITSPLPGAVVEPPFNLTFAVSNWDVMMGSTHLKYFIDGMDQGPHYDLTPINIAALDPGPHTLRVELADMMGNVTGVFDEIMVTVPVPSITIDSPLDGADVTLPFQVEFTIENWDAHVELKIDGMVVELGHALDPFDIDMLALGMHTITCTLLDPMDVPTMYFDEITINVIDVPPPPAVEMRVNCGGPAINALGVDWMADTYFSGGNTFTNLNPINNTDGDALYQSERYGNCTYEIPVPNGLYNCSIHLCEIFFGAPGAGPPGADQRIFDINIEDGQVFLDDIDLFVEVGPVWADIRTFNDIDVQDGSLTISFQTEVDNAKVSAIEVLSAAVIDPPTITIDLPLDGADVTSPFNCEFTVENWNVMPGGEHIHSFVDGAFYMMHTTTDPIVFNLPTGLHSIELALVDAGHNLIGVSDTILCNVLGDPPTITIDSPLDMAVLMMQPFDVEFTVENWTVAPGLTHIHSYIDGALSGPLYSLDPWTISGLAPGPHTLTLELQNADHTPTGIFDEITVTVPAPPPTITIDSPLDGATLQDPFNVDFTVENWVVAPGMSYVGAYIDNVLVEDLFTLDPWAVTGLVPGMYTLKLELHDAAMNPTGVFDEITVTVTALPPVVTRINCGGPELNYGGDIWMADQYFTGGWAFTNPIAIDNTTMDELYQSEHVDNTTYDIPVVGTGPFECDLHFAEIFWGVPGGGPGGAGLRVFDVMVEGSPAITNLDLNVVAGPNTAYIMTVPGITVNDGFLTISTVGVIDLPKISAIEVRGGTPLPPMPNVTITSPAMGDDVTAPFDIEFFVQDWLDLVDVAIDGMSVGTTATSPFTVNALPVGPHTITLTLLDGANMPTMYTDTVSFNVIDIPPPPAFELRINCGGPEVMTGGETWSADSFFLGGLPFSFPHAVEGTTDDIIYQSERALDHSYAIPVPLAGDYTVILHFAEMFFGAPGAGQPGVGLRVFDVDIEDGEGFINDLDLFSEAGPTSAVIKTFNGVTCNDGILDITLIDVVENPKISAIEIYSEAP